MYDSENIFVKIIKGETPTDLIYEDKYLIAINDIKPVAPIHILVIPKGRYENIIEFNEKATPLELIHYFRTITEITKAQGIEEYRLVINNGSSAGQSVFHFHTHIIAGAKFGKLI